MEGPVLGGTIDSSIIANAVRPWRTDEWGIVERGAREGTKACAAMKQTIEWTRERADWVNESAATIGCERTRRRLNEFMRDEGDAMKEWKSYVVIDEWSEERTMARLGATIKNSIEGVKERADWTHESAATIEFEDKKERSDGMERMTFEWSDEWTRERADWVNEKRNVQNEVRIGNLFWKIENRNEVRTSGMRETKNGSICKYSND